MRPLLGFIAALGASAVALASTAASPRRFWQNTHQRFTEEALFRSAGFRQFAQDIDFNLHPLVGEQVIQANLVDGVEIGAPQSAEASILAGAVLEDGVSLGDVQWNTAIRTPRHFQDAAGNGLFSLSSASDWGASNDGLLPNHHSWTRAFGFLEQFMTGPDEYSQSLALEEALVCLGCNLHLLQDQFQPSHTRRDPHMGHDLPANGLGSGVSELEGYAAQVLTPTSSYAIGPVAIPAFTQRDQYFTNAVQWTSSQFLSDDTIEDAVALLPGFPHPVVPADLTIVPELACGPSSTELTDFFRHNTLQSMGGGGAYMARKKFEKECSPVVGPGGTIVAFTCNDVPKYTLLDEPCGVTQERILRDHLAQLAPQAVGYSAGLLDFFFRGRLELQRLPGGDLEIKNVSQLASTGEPLALSAGAESSGAFLICYERSDGSRAPIPGISPVPLQPGGLAFGAAQVVPGVAGKLPDDAWNPGGARIYVMFHNGNVGGDVGFALRWTSFELCSSLCLPQTALAVRPAGDVNGDGNDDFLVRTPQDPGSSPPGLASLTAYSGGACEALWKVYGSKPLDGFGDEALPVGDLSGEGAGDLVCKSRLVQLPPVSGQPPKFEFYYSRVSGTNGASLGEFSVASFGKSVAVGDVSGDGVGDFVIQGTYSGVPNVPPKMICYSGKTGLTLKVLGDVESGAKMSAASDWSGDGALELLVEKTDGSFRILSTANGAVLASKQFSNGFEPSHTFTDVVGLTDMNEDNIPDFVARNGKGDLAVFSGKNNGIWTQELAAVSQVAPAGDFNGDGKPDFTTRKFVPPPAQGDPPSYILSVRAAFDGQWFHAFTQFETVASLPLPIGDLNSDGRTDLSYVEYSPSLQLTCVHLVYGRTP